MIRLIRITALLSLTTLFTACASQGHTPEANTGAGPTPAQPSVSIPENPDDIPAWVQSRYTKREVMIPMRDGVRLFAAIYEPRDTSQRYPIMMHRTPYSSGPYGEDEYPSRLRPHPDYWEDGYIFVNTDVRGRFASEGKFVNMTPHVPVKSNNQDIDESTDAFDTIDWLISNIENHNGRVGMAGISYPGFYSAASMIDAHPNLVAVSPQAPIADWWYDDFHHHGALFLPHAFNFLSRFGLPLDEPFYEWPDRPFEYPTVDGYDFYLNHIGTLETLRSDDYVGDTVDFWNQLVERPNRDEFWEARDILPHLNRVAPNVLTVGGWFDAEDLYGPLRIYESIERRNPGVDNMLVMGPWRHGGWARSDGSMLGDQYFGEGISEYYRKYIEQPWFRHLLKDGPEVDLPEAMVFETGRNIWHNMPAWPPREARERNLYFGEAGTLSMERPERSSTVSDSFVSDPNKPVPYSEYVGIGMDARYMTEDQRFASRRTDVLVYQTEPLDRDITMAGPLTAEIFVSTTGTAADWVVKIIDVQPGNAPDTPATREGKRTGGAHLMVRSEVIRGRFRNSHSDPEPFVPNEVTRVELPIQDVLHTFKRGHRIMIHVQSTWFPMVDRNPQVYLDNPYMATEDDFTAQTHTVHRSQNNASRILFNEIDGATLERTRDTRFTTGYSPN